MDIEILLALQQFREGAGGFLAEFLNKMTFLGDLYTAPVIMAVVYWCVNKDFGTYLLLGWSGNRIVNGALKVTACAYRPWIRDARIVPYELDKDKQIPQPDPSPQAGGGWDHVGRTRLYVHLSGDAETARKVGCRHGKPVIYTVLSGEMARAGATFHRSVNGVWLVKAVPPQYLKKA